MICNISIAAGSTPPLLIVDVEDGEVKINLPTLQRALKWFDWFPGSVKIVYYDAGVLANFGAAKLFPENKIELIPVLTSYTSSQPIGVLTPILLERRIVMMSLAPEVRTKSKDILDLFDWELWTFGGLFLLTALLMMRLLISYKSLNGIRDTLKTIIWSTVKLISLQDFSPRMFGTSKILMASLLFFIFFLAAFLNSMISTDLVIGEEPFTINKLEDVLDARASKFRPVWRKYSGVHEIFSKSHSPIKQRIWQRAKDIGIDRCLVDADITQALDMVIYYSNSPKVGFIYDMTANFIRIQSCGQIFPIQGRRIHIGSETIGEELLSFPYHLRNDSCKGRKKAAIEAWAMTVLEADPFNEAFVESAIMDVFKVHDDPSDKWECLFNEDPFERKYWIPIRASNINQLLLLLLCGIILSFFILLSENFWFRGTQ
ncbi:uncharacterized protein LOC141850793 [Brevipalpus obovatus]|uniref:uncharacterized protein LOC141850793 n=1 Tax=Brevipalpus obovatus TaxID=246614 RepID=UPI003D9F078C